MGSGDLVPRVYGSFRGVDFRGEEINIVRSPDSKNMWKDYRETDSIRTRPGLTKVFTAPGLGTDKINGIFFYTAADTEMMIVHYGTALYKVIDGEETVLRKNVKNAKSNAFIYNNVWFFKDGENYLQYDGAEIKDVEGYIPTTSINRKPVASHEFASGGEILEDVNLLSDYRINTFIGSGDERENCFVLDAAVSREDCHDVEVLINGENAKENGYEVIPVIPENEEEARIYWISPSPPEPLTVGQNNVSIKFKRASDKNRILKCTLSEVFDNRVFFSGNPDFPNMIWHCSLNDPTYCSDLDYYNEGLDTAEVKGMVAGNNALWVFKEPSQANTTIFYHTPTIDNEYGKIYPNTHSSIATGCVGKAINFNDDIVFFSERGMEGISGDVTTEQVVAHRSSLVDRKLLAETNYADMTLVEWEGYLAVIIGKKIYLADSRATFTNEDHFEYEWFYWEFDKEINCAAVNKGVLYLGTGKGEISGATITDKAAVYTLTKQDADMESYWVTPKDKFGHPHYLKTTNKRGCVVEAKGDVSVYAKTEKTEFELIGKYKNVTDAFVSRIKRKKFKDIQLKFHSDTRFSLEQATLECFIGGYIKR